MRSGQRATIEARIGAERGTLHGRGRRSVALVYPSPYPVGISSLGFQSVYRAINHLPDASAERAFLPDEGSPLERGEPLLTYESMRPVSDFHVVAFSVAYELEIAGLFDCLKHSGIEPLREARRPRDPWIVIGGPLTFSNPVPLAPFADVIVMGEAEELLEPLVDGLFDDASREKTLAVLAERPGFYIPSIHGEEVPSIVACDSASLPAVSVVRTEEAVLSNMILVEAERGCSRGCTFCVMRRSTNGGMRTVPVERIFSSIPEDAPRVGLVGAAVSDHPEIQQIVARLVDSGREVGLSSLRSDRLNDELVEMLVRGGYRTLTVASDGASQRLRTSLEKKIREKHLLRAAELAGKHGVKQLKVYMMIGAPDERDEDLEELVRFSQQQAAAAGPLTKLSLGVGPFVAKRNTPLSGAPFVGIKEAERRMERLRRELAPRVDVRSASARWAWVEYVLARGGPEVGLAAFDAWKNGGGFGDWKRAFARFDFAKEAAS